MAPTEEANDTIMRASKTSKRTPDKMPSMKATGNDNDVNNIYIKKKITFASVVLVFAKSTKIKRLVFIIFNNCASII